MSQCFSIEYEFNESMADRAARAFIAARRKDSLTKFWKALPLPLLFTTFFGSVAVLGYEAKMPFVLLLFPGFIALFFGAILAVVVSLNAFVILLSGVLRRRVRRQFLAPFPPTLDRTVRWIFTSDRFEVHSAITDRKVFWSDVRSFRTIPGFLIVGIKEGPELLFPADQFTVEVQDLIREKAALLSIDPKNLKAHS